MRNENAPELTNIKKLRRGDADVFEWFVDNVLTCILTKGTVDKAKVNKQMSKWVTVGLEAFALLCLENCYEQVSDKVEGKPREDQTRPRWTDGGKGSGTNRGWDLAGMARCGEL
jgi:hypothetical protein